MKKQLINFITISVLFSFSACVSTVPALYMKSEFEQLGVNKIYLLPTVDLRLDTSKQLKTDKWVHNVMRKQLKQKKYQSHSLSNRALIADITEENLMDDQPSWLSTIELDEARWILLPILHDVSTKATFGSTGNAEMSAMLFDRNKQVLIWRHKTASKVGQGGLIGLAMKGAMAQSAIEMASLRLAQALPKR